MPEWLMAAGYSYGQPAGETECYTPFAQLRGNFIEAHTQVRSRDSYTWAKLFVRVTGNTLAGATTVRSRINGGNGNQTVSIGAGATGTFTDAVNSDGLVSGSLFNWCVVAGAGGTSIVFSVLASTLTTVANTTPIVGATDQGIRYWGPSLTSYFTYLGLIVKEVLEVNVQYRFRTAATLSNFRIYVADNELTAASTFRVRRNGANGNQSVSVPGGGTGSYEDVGNTDNFAIADLMNYQVVSGGTGIDIGITVVQVKLDSQIRHIGCSGNVNLLYNAAPRYTAIEGLMENLWTGTEADQRANALADFTLRNMYVRMMFNWHDGIITIRTRKNGGNGSLAVSIGAGLTGEFEDLVNSDDFLAADSLDWQLVFGGGAGNCRVQYIGAELVQPAAGPAGPVGKSIAEKMVAGSLI